MPQIIKPQYVPKTLEQMLGYLVEESGEVQSAVGKAIRWGLDSSSPELPPEEWITNRQWILNELVDLERAIGYVRGELTKDKAPTIERDSEGNLVVTTFFDGKEQVVKFSQEAINDMATKPELIQIYKWGRGYTENLPTTWYRHEYTEDRWEQCREGSGRAFMHRDNIFALEDPTGKPQTEPLVVTKFPGSSKTEPVQIYEWGGDYRYEVPTHWYRAGIVGVWEKCEENTSRSFLLQYNVFALEDPTGKETTETKIVTEFPSP